MAAEIGGMAFYDSDGDGVYESSAGETGAAAVVVRLYDRGADGVIGGGDDNLCGETTTSAAGAYSFTNLPDDTYYVVFVAPSGKIFTLQDQGGDDALDSDVDANGYTGEIAVSGAQVVSDVDAGLVSPCTVGNFVFVDDDGDGIQDSGEAGAAGVTVRLFDAGADGAIGGGDDTQVGVTATNSSGVYTFTNVLHGDHYIRVDAPTGFVFSPQDQGSSDSADSDVDPGTGLSAVFTLTVAQTDLTRDAGIYEYAEVSGRVFEDLDGDGVRESGDGDLSAAATVQLFSVGADGLYGTADDAQVGADVNTTSTYTFASVTPGKYYVKFAPPGGVNLSLVPKDRGSDDTLDSDAEPSTGATEAFRLTSGSSRTNVDAGFARYSTIGDFVFRDDDEDGVQDAGEPGVADVLVMLFSSTDATAGNADDAFVASTVSDDSGAYGLSAVAGTYFLQFVPPTGYALTLQNQGSDDALDSDPGPASQRTAVFTLAEDAADTTRDAGLVADADGDGTRDSADGCPNDPGKVDPGVCGCGVSDADTDSDGVEDCVDNCPLVANPTQSDADADGVGDACEAAGAGEEDTDQGAALPDLPREGEGEQDGTEGEDDTDTSSDAEGETLPTCGACGAMGMAAYGVLVAGYGGFLMARRCRRR